MNIATPSATVWISHSYKDYAEDGAETCLISSNNKVYFNGTNDE